MPIFFENDEPVDLTTATDLSDTLVDEEGNATIDTEVMSAFINTVDFNPVFEDEDVQDYVQTELSYLVPMSEAEDAPYLILSEDELEEMCKDGSGHLAGKQLGAKNGKKYRKAEYMGMKESIDEETGEAVYAEDDCDQDEINLDDWMFEDEAGTDYDDSDRIYIIETDAIAGDLVDAVIDMDDITEMFAYYCATELPATTLEERAVFAQFADLYEVEDITEDDQLDEKSPFKRGDFRKGAFKNAKQGTKLFNVRARMFSAMLKKGVLRRVKSGKGYKGGTYKYKGDKTGTAQGKSRYARIRKRNYRRASDIKKMVGSARAKVVKMIYRNLGKKMPKPYSPPESRLKRKRKSASKALKGGDVSKASVKSIKKNVSTGSTEKNAVSKTLAKSKKHAAGAKAKVRLKAKDVKKKALAKAASKSKAKKKKKVLPESQYETKGIGINEAVICAGAIAKM